MKSLDVVEVNLRFALYNIRVKFTRKVNINYGREKHAGT